jgi:hypothetical protein
MGFCPPDCVVDWMEACHQKVDFGSPGASFDWMEAYTSDWNEAILEQFAIEWKHAPKR